MKPRCQNILGWLTGITATVAALAAMALPADADQNTYQMKIGKDDINVDVKNARQGNVYVAKTDTVRDDLVTRDGSITVDGVVEGDVAALGGTVAINGSVDGDVAAFGGGVAVGEQAHVTGKIAAFGGSIELLGKAGDDLACFGGSVNLGPKAEVDGDIATMGGVVDQKPGAKVGGEIKNIHFRMFERFLPGGVHSFDYRHQEPPPVVRAVTQTVRFLLALVVIAVIGLLLLLVVLLFPGQVERIANSIQNDFWTSAGAGMLIEVAIFPALLLMVISILGIPLIPVALLLLAAAVVMAYAAFGLLVYRKLTVSAGWTARGLVPCVMIGYLALNVLYIAAALIRIIPHVGFLAGLLTAVNILVTWFGLTIGLGAVWRTRFGTRSVTLPIPAVTPPAPPPPVQIESGRSGIA
jgi:cytoskeletal protein CcmA (bactofilin family)